MCIAVILKIKCDLVKTIIVTKKKMWVGVKFQGYKILMKFKYGGI